MLLLCYLDLQALLADVQTTDKLHVQPTSEHGCFLSINMSNSDTWPKQQ